MGSGFKVPRHVKALRYVFRMVLDKLDRATISRAGLESQNMHGCKTSTIASREPCPTRYDCLDLFVCRPANQDPEI